MSFKSASNVRETENEIKLYEGEMTSCLLPSMPERENAVTVSLQLPEKVWFIDGHLVLTRFRIVFLPRSIRGKFFPTVFNQDQPEYLSIYLASIDHLVLVQAHRKKTKLRSFSPGQTAGLPDRVDKLEIHCCDFTRLLLD